VSLSRFGFHPQGVNNAKLDGSVKFLPQGTDIELLVAADTRGG